MTLLFFTSLLLVPILAAPSQGGTVSGVLKDASGKPAAGVRVAAVQQPESLTNSAANVAMARIVETDANGRYVLDDIPQGRYFISAGRLDQPTYYPGAKEMTRATIVSVMPGTAISGIDFTLDQTSAGRAVGFGTTSVVQLQLSLLNIPVEVRVESDGKIPISHLGTFPSIQLTGTPVSSTTVLASTFIGVYGPPADYKPEVVNLPPGYSVQSITYGNTDLTKESLKLSAADFPPIGTAGVATVSGVGLPTQTVRILTTTGTILVTGTATLPIVVGATTSPPPRPPSTLIITLRPPPPSGPPPNGVRLRGQIPQTPIGLRRTIYVSGSRGTVYSDGTFVVDGVPPGLHTVLSLDDPSLFGAVVAVGDKDVEDIVLSSIPFLPAGARNVRAPEPAGNIPAGTILRWPSVRGQVLDDSTQDPASGGTVMVFGVGQYKSYSIGTDGRFEIQGLYPGTYTLDIATPGHVTVSELVTVSGEDKTLQIRARQ